MADAPRPAPRESPRAGDWAERLVARPGWVLLGLALLVLAAAPGLGQLRFEASIERFTDIGSPEGRVLSETRATFGSDDVLVLVQIGAEHAVERGRLRRLRDLGERIEHVPGVVRVWSIAQAGWIDGSGDAVEVLDLAEETPAPGPALARLRSEIGASPLHRAHLLSSDGRTAALVVFLEDRPGDPLFQQSVVDAVREIIRTTPGPERLVLSGNPAFTVDVGREMEKEQRLFTGVTLVLLALLLLRIFRRPLPVVLPLLSAGGAVVVVLGAMSLLGHSVSVLSTIVPSMVLAIGTAYSMHFLVQVERPGGSAARALRAVARPTLLTAATNMAGFASLATSQIAAIREFGVVAALAVGLTGLFALLVPAAVYAWWPPRSTGLRRPDGVDRFLESCCALARARPRLLVAGSVLAVVVFGAGLTRLAVDTSFVAFLAPDHPANRDRLEVVERVAGPIPLVVTLDAGRPDGVLSPEVLRHMAAIEEFALTQPGVRATLSVADLIAEMNRAWLGEDKPRQSLPAALPASTAAAAQLLLLYESSNFAEDLTRLVTPERDRAAIWVRTDVFASAEAAKVSQALQTQLDATIGDLSPRVTGTVLSLFRSSDEIARGQLRSLLTALLVIGAILVALVRSPRFAIAAALPNLLPLVVLFGAMGWLSVPLNMGTALVACISLGIATDDTIHFLLAVRDAEARGADDAVGSALLDVGRPIVLTSVVLAVAFGALVISGFGPVRDLGVLTAATMALCVLGTIVLLPAVLQLWPRRLGEGAAGSRAPREATRS